jgi:ATP-binding cassette subfamily B protein
MKRPDGQARHRKQPGSHLLLRLWRYTPHHRSIFLASTYSVVNKLFDLSPPLLIGVAADIVVQQENSILARWGVADVRMQLVLLGALTLVIWGFESIFEYLSAIGCGQYFRPHRAGERSLPAGRSPGHHV